MRSCGAIMRAGRRSSRRTTSPPSSARFRNRTRTTAMIRSTDRILTTHAGALPRSSELRQLVLARAEGQPHDGAALAVRLKSEVAEVVRKRSEEHTSELQSPCNLVCRLLLEKKKKCKVSDRGNCEEIHATDGRA